MVNLGLQWHVPCFPPYITSQWTVSWTGIGTQVHFEEQLNWVANEFCLLSYTCSHPLPLLLPPHWFAVNLLPSLFFLLKVSHCANHYFPFSPSSWTPKRLHFPAPCSWWNHVTTSSQWAGSRSVTCYSWEKAFKSKCATLHILSPLEWSICWSGSASDENSYNRECSFPRQLPDSQRGLCRNKEQTCVKPLRFRYYLLQQRNLVCSKQHQALRPIWPKPACICIC